MENRALGKGLSALIPGKLLSEDLESVDPTQISSIPTAQIRDNRVQPRSNYASAALEELKQSIRQSGMLQPILVRKTGDGYEVVAGERRLRAARSLNLPEVPAVVRQVSDNEALILALVENIQREELNALEEAQAYKRLMDDFGMTTEQVGQAVGKANSTVNNSVRLLKLPELIRNALSEGMVSMGHARALLGVENASEQQRLFQEVMTKSLSVREVENQVQLRRAPGSRPLTKRAKEKHHEILFLEEELQRILGTKVRIQAKKKRGKIVIEYYSQEDFDRVLEVIRG